MAKKFLFFIFFLSILLYGQAVLAIGMMTEPIIIENVIKGQELQETLLLINSENRPVDYFLSAEGDIRNWVSFDYDKVTLGPNSELETSAKIKAPHDIPNGKYRGQIIITTAPEKQEQASSSALVKLKIGRNVSITITDKEVIKLESQIIPLNYGIAKNKPLEIKIIYNNQGNIFLKPDVSLKITKSEAPIFEAIFPYIETEAVKPRESKEVLIKWQSAGQENGLYDAEVKVLLGDEVIGQDNFRFQTGVQKNIVLGFIAKIGGGNLTLAWLIIGGMLIAIAAILTILMKKKGL